MKTRFSLRYGFCLAVFLALSGHSRGVQEGGAGYPEALPPANVDPVLSVEPLPEESGAHAVSPLAEPADNIFEEFLDPDLEEMEDLEGVYEGSTVLPANDGATGLNGEVVGWRKNVFPYFRIGGLYDDNIFISEEHKESDFVGFAGFGLRLGLGEVVPPLRELRERRGVASVYYDTPAPSGNFAWVDYAGIYRVFADHPDQSAYDQDALISLGWTDGKLTLGLDGRFQSLSTPDIDAGGRVRRYIFNTAASASYELSDLTSVEVDVSYTNTQYTGLIDSSEFLNENWLNYQITPKLKVAPGIGVGVLTMQGGPNQPYGRVLVRAIYEYSAKLSFNGKLGLEYRDVQEGSPFRNNPVFGLGVNYAPRDGTFISLEGYRYAEASALLAGADYTITGVDLTLRQRFLQRFFVTLAGGYENRDYHLVSDDSSPQRHDHYFFGRAAVAFDITRWCNAEVFYIFQRDSSSHPGNSFSDNQVGIGFDFAF